jgi:hypothetical protein
MIEEIVAIEKDDRCLCQGSGLALAPKLVDLMNGRGYCPDCGQQVPVWLSELLYREPHYLPVNADTVSA